MAFASQRRFAAGFGLKVLLPSFAAVIVIATLLFNVINGLLAEMSSANEQYARQAAKALVATVKEQFASIASDNATWDEAVAHSYGTPDLAWLSDTWGRGSTQGAYDTAALLDSSGQVLAAFRNGKAERAEAMMLGGLDATGLATAVMETGARPEARSALTYRAGAAWLTAIAPIVPSAGVGQEPQGGWRYLLLATELKPEAIAKRGKIFGVENTQLAAGSGNGLQFLILNDLSGEPSGYLTWSLPHDEALARDRFAKVVWAILGSLIVVISILVNMSWKGFREAHAVKQQAIESALRDDLTGLPNRRRVIELLNELLSQPSTPDNAVSVIYADLDGFKEVNDAYGHEIGDQLLKSAAGGFEFLAGGQAVVSRLGGDEFCLVISGPNSAGDARLIAENMRRFLAEPIVFGGRVASVSVSVGIADRPPGDTALDAEEFLRRADAAMYAAKTAGRNRLQIYERSLDNKREEARRIARDLRAHLDSQSLTVVYQPIIEARSRRICGVEALVRWPRSAPMNVTPDVFVPIAEEFGMIEELGHFVLMQACREAVHWPSLSMSVNVSPIQFMNPSFADSVERVLTLTGLDPARLEIEVTEGFIIDNADRAKMIIEKLHAMRVSVALDDFGTGFSSIGHLRRFKFDKLKLDRSMVMDILRQPSALRLVQGTIAMADALGLKVTAEGIEDENQVSVLRLAGCSFFQGYLFSKPVEARQIGAMVATGNQAIAV